MLLSNPPPAMVRHLSLLEFRICVTVPDGGRTCAGAARAAGPVDTMAAAAVRADAPIVLMRCFVIVYHFPLGYRLRRCGDIGTASHSPSRCTRARHEIRRHFPR